MFESWEGLPPLEEEPTTITKGKKPKHLYRAEVSSEWGINQYNHIVAGVELVPVPEDDDVDDTMFDITDPVTLEVSEAGVDAQVFLPEEGLVPGKLYRVRVETFKDWETGVVDGWEIYVVRADEPDKSRDANREFADGE